MSSKEDKSFSHRRRSLGLSRNRKGLQPFNSPVAKLSNRGTASGSCVLAKGESPGLTAVTSHPSCIGSNKSSVPETPVKDSVTENLMSRQTCQLKISSRKRLQSPVPSATTTARKKFKTDFKSPMRSNKDSVSQQESCHQVGNEIVRIKTKLDEVNEEIQTLEESGYSLDETKQHLDRLHQYNELKDLGQHLIGQIAMKNGTTTSHEYPKFGLDLND